MYNPIEAIRMEIKKVTIKNIQKGSLSSSICEGIQHIKILPFLSIVQAVEGCYEIRLGDGKMLNTGEGGFFVAPSDMQQTIVHHVNKQSGKMNARWIFIDVIINDAHHFDKLYQLPIIADEKTKYELNDYFDILFENRGILEDYACCYRILSILLNISKEKKGNTKNPVYLAVEHIEQHYSSDIRVSDLAKSACTSESNLYALFKKNFGISPIAYLNRYRLSVAAQMLSETDLNISSIGLKTGIKDSLYFSRMFKRSYGVSPREYRKTHGNQKQNSSN